MTDSLLKGVPFAWGVKWAVAQLSLRQGRAGRKGFRGAQGCTAAAVDQRVMSPGFVVLKALPPGQPEVLTTFKLGSPEEY